MKKISNYFISIPLTLMAAMVFNTSVFAQGNQPNAKILDNQSVQQAQNQYTNEAEEMPYPWIDYKGFENSKEAKQAWVKDNRRAYLKMLPASLTKANPALMQSLDALNITNDAKPIMYNNQVASLLSEAGSANVGVISGTIGATYSFVATSSFTRISTCNPGTNFDTELHVYNVTNGELVQIASNDDACGLSAELYLPTTIGETYYAVVNGYNNSLGNVLVEIFAAAQPATNPPFGQPCPLKLVLVLDESGSIGSLQANFVRSGVNSFVAGLLNTGTQMAIVEFSDLANSVTLNGSSGLQTVDAAYQGAVSSYLSSNYSPSGWTNWAAAFDEVYTLNPDLVIFFTDGVPTRPLPISSSLDAAITASNAVKNQGTRVFMLGVGNSVPIANLQAVSGPNMVNPPTTPFITADFGLQGDFADIEASLITLSTAFLTDYYADIDGDGYGAGPATNECAGGLAGYVLNNDDCDDADASVYPGAPDLCDGIANDCSNPNWPTPDVLDTDDDGDGLSECAGDCDDTDANVYPGAPEICDGKDNDCSGAIDDADCDGVEDLCDICPGGDDSIDADGDGLPDCAYEPTVYDPSWECDAKGKKVTVCHVDEYGNRFELCVSKNAAAGHLSHGDFLGPCIDCGDAKTTPIIQQGQLILKAYPVPVVDYFFAEVTVAESATAHVTLTDYLGRIVLDEEFDLQAGENTLEIDASAIGSGIYLLNVSTQTSSSAIKITVQ